MIQFFKTFVRVVHRNLHKFLKQKIQSKNCEILLTTGIPSYHLNAINAIYLLHALYRKKSLHHSIEGESFIRFLLQIQHRLLEKLIFLYKLQYLLNHLLLNVFLIFLPLH